MSSYLKTFLQGSAISLLGAGVLGIVNYLIRRMLCNNMTLADYGIFYSTFALLSLIFVFTDLGLTQSGTVMIASSADEPEKRDTVFTHLFVIKGLLAAVCSIGIFLVFQLKPISLDWIFLLLFLCYFTGQIILGTLHALWGGQKKFHIQQTAYIAVAVMTITSLFIFNNFELRFISICFLVPVAVVLGSGLLYSRFTKSGNLCFRWDKDVCKKLLTMGGLIAITTTLLTIMYYMDTVMLNALQGPESAGLYNVALPIMQIVQAGMIFPGVFLPIAVEMGKNKEYRKLLTFVRYALLFAIAAILPVGLFFHFTSSWLISFLFKPEYTDASHAVTILCLGLIFFTLGNFLFQIMLCLKKTVTMAIVAVICTLINVGLNYYLIRYNGVNGAAIATLISYTVFALFTYIALEYYLKQDKHEHGE